MKAYLHIVKGNFYNFLENLCFVTRNELEDGNLYFGSIKNIISSPIDFFPVPNELYKSAISPANILKNYFALEKELLKKDDASHAFYVDALDFMHASVSFIKDELFDNEDDIARAEEFSKLYYDQYIDRSGYLPLYYGGELLSDYITEDFRTEATYIKKLFLKYNCFDAESWKYINWGTNHPFDKVLSDDELVFLSFDCETLKKRLDFFYPVNEELQIEEFVVPIGKNDNEYILEYSGSNFKTYRHSLIEKKWIIEDDKKKIKNKIWLKSLKKKVNINKMIRNLYPTKCTAEGYRNMV